MLQLPLLSAIILLLALAGCNAPDAVSKFAASATATLSSAKPLFADMKQSCLREVDSRVPIGSFELPKQSDPGCDRIGEQAEGAEAAAKILSDYFTAINEVASFGTAQTGSDAQTLVSTAGTAVGAGSTAQTALSSMAQFLVSAGTAGYQRKSLNKDLTKVSGNISAVIDALVRIVEVNYIGQQLLSEEQKLRTRYLEFAGRNPSQELKLMLDDRWHADEQVLQTRRAAAESLVTALRAISKGAADLAASSKSGKEKSH
jgi:hypothetical protein